MTKTIGVQDEQSWASFVLQDYIMMVKVEDVIELHRQGNIEEAYTAVRVLYAADKSSRISLAMFWIAVDILRVRVGENRIYEATKILMALERMLPNVSDKEDNVYSTYESCCQLLDKAQSRDQYYVAEHIQTGIWGEEVAADYLRKKGYAIIERDWHSGHRDIDIIARDGEYVVFVEVKTRRNIDFGDPVMAVDYKKRCNLRSAINHYIKYRKVENPVRFDIITVIGTPSCANPEINHIENVRIVDFSRHKRYR